MMIDSLEDELINLLGEWELRAQEAERAGSGPFADYPGNAHATGILECADDIRELVGLERIHGDKIQL